MQASLSKKFLQLVFASSLIGLGACAPTPEQIKKAVEQDPSIVFVAIEKAPDKFMEVVMKAQQDAQAVAGKKQQEDETKARDAEFANPLKPVIEESRVFFGNKSAPITIVEYSDFQCPFCKRGFQTMEQVKKEYGDKVRILFKHMPLDFHPLAMPAALYYEAIAQQDHKKAEEFHNMVFENQDMLKDKGEAYFKEVTKKVGANLKQVETDMKSDKVKKQVETDMAEAKSFNINGTPGFLINGVSLRGAYPFPAFKEIIDKHLASAK
jgi:protein-disulfide isomerase